MMVKRNFFTLTLMGLMAAAFIFPVYALAQMDGEESPVLITPEADANTYQLTPTLEWSAVSGATKFEITIGTLDPITTATEPNLTTEDPTPDDPASGDEKKKWAERLAADADTAKAAAIDMTSETPTAVANCYADTASGKTVCFYKYTPAEGLLSSGATTWQVKAIRDLNEDGDITADDKDFNSAVSTSESRNLSIYSPVSMSIATDKAELEAEQTVKVTVSLNNNAATSGLDTPLDALSCNLIYGNAFTITDGDVTTAGSAVGSTVDVNTDTAGSVVVALTTDTPIEAGAGGIIDLVFTANADAEAAPYDFSLANCVAVSNDIVYDGTENLGDAANNPVTLPTEPVSVTVLSGIDQGNVNGDEAVDLQDAILAIKVLAGMPTDDDAVALTSYTARYGKITMETVIFILVQVAAG